VAEEKTSGTFHVPSFALGAILLAAVLLAYSQTYAFAWDEGFHLIAAKLISTGKRPYLDFVFAQTPLNAYWNAAWMRILGENWRAIHAIDALLTTSAIVLSADFLRSRVDRLGGRFQQWGTAGVLAVIVFAGANLDTVEFGTIAQAYAFGLLLIVCAFRLTVASVQGERPLAAVLAGCLAGAAAGSTLLTAPAAPVLLLWTLFYGSARKRLILAASFIAGVLISLIPLLKLFLQSPARVIFDVFRYHMFYRRSDWPGATRHDVELVTSWLESPGALILGILAVTGLWFIVKRSDWDSARRSEFYLCGWMALAMGLYVSTAHPTFSQYYIFTIPFLGILASVGMFAIVNQFATRGLAPATIASEIDLPIPLWPLVAVSLLVCLNIARTIYDRRDDTSWPGMEQIARKVREVTPAGAPLYADEPTYFLTKRIPPPGNEYISSHKLRLPAALSELVHIVPQPEFDRRIIAGTYDTVETCDDEDWIKEVKLDEIYRHKAEVSDCLVYWDRNPKTTK
jgi:hypothetical protein